MALSIKDEEADRLARSVAALTGETLTAAVVTALRERLRILEGRRQTRGLAARLRQIGEHCAVLPVLSTCSEDEILGYNVHGIPE